MRVSARLSPLYIGGVCKGFSSNGLGLVRRILLEERSTLCFAQAMPDYLLKDPVRDVLKCASSDQSSE